MYAKFYGPNGIASPVQHLSIPYRIEETHPSPTPLPSPQSQAPNTKPSAPIFRFMRNLTSGDRGTDVKYLQQFLNTHGFPLAKTGAGSLGKETTVFGPLLKQALIRFQQKNANRLLTPLHLKKGTGIFSTLTRALINSLLQAEK